MTDEAARSVERGILRAVGKLVLIVVAIAVLAMIGRGLYVNSEAYRDRQANDEMFRRLSR